MSKYDVKPGTKVVCPECKQKFHPNSMHEHRLKAHGVPRPGHVSGVTGRVPMKALKPPKPKRWPIDAAVAPAPDPAADGQTHCPECGLGFAKRSAFFDHRRDVHGISEYRQRNATKEIAPNGNATVNPPAAVSTSEQEFIQRQIAYATGRVEGLISAIAESAGAPPAELTQGVADLLRRKKVR